MALKDIFKMTKANRYTADGREVLIKAQEAVTEDRRYNIGEISEKTGLQKTANGWVKPKGGAGKTESKSAESTSSAPKTESKPAAESKSTESVQSAPKAPKPSVQEYMKAKQRVKAYEEKYKKDMDDYEYMERIKANGVDTSIFNPMYGGKPKPLEENKSYMEELNKIKAYEAKDSAPRVLTGDTRIRVRK